MNIWDASMIDQAAIGQRDPLIQLDTFEHVRAGSPKPFRNFPDRPPEAWWNCGIGRDIS